MTAVYRYAEELEDDVAEPSIDGESARVLVVEDDPDFADLMRFELETGGYAVEVTSSVGEARRRIRGGAFDLVISDVRLPGESGVELLFADTDVRRPPVLMMTAFVSKELREFLKWTGAAVLEKPFSFGHLHARVTDILMRGARSKAEEQAKGVVR